MGVTHIPRIQPLRSALHRGATSVVPLTGRAIGNLQQWLTGTYHGVSRPSSPSIWMNSSFATTVAERHKAFQTLLGLGTRRAPTPNQQIRHAGDLVAQG